MREQPYAAQPAPAVPQDISPRIRMLANELRRESPSLADGFLSAIESSEPARWSTICAVWTTTLSIRRDLRLSQSADVARLTASGSRGEPEAYPRGANDPSAKSPARKRLESPVMSPSDYLAIRPGDDEFVQKAEARQSDPIGLVEPAVSEAQLRTEAIRLVRMMEAQAELLRDPAFLQDRQRLELSARVLALLANNRSKALETIESMPPQERQFARELIVALDALVGLNQQPRSARQAEAIDHLQNAVNVLREQAELDCSVPIFCTRVDSFQKFVPFQDTVFSQNQQVLIYWEVRNFSSQLVPDGYKTSIQPKLEIIDQNGHVRLLEQDPQNEYTSVRRQDYFLTIRLNWPKDLPAGGYVLRVTTSDRLNERQCVREANFAIAQPQPVRRPF